MKKLQLLFFLLLPAMMQAQMELDAGVFGGFANYQGDLAEDAIELSETKISYGVFARFHVHRKLKVRANAYYGFISGDDANADAIGLKERGWRFESKVLEFSLLGEFHPFGKKRLAENGIFDKQISPYIGLGFGLANYDATIDANDDQDLFPEADEKSTSFVVPIVLGARADISEHFSLGVEWGWRATFSDYVDRVSVNGNPDHNDWYLFTGLSASYFFGGSESYGFEEK